jgi:hypothetical protein
MVLISLGILVIVGFAVYGQKQSAPRVVWEYKVVSETDKIPLNDMGAQGWELVTVEMGGAQEVYYFKRVK